MDKHQGPTVYHKELCPVSCDKPYGKGYEKDTYMDIYGYISMYIHIHLYRYY